MSLINSVRLTGAVGSIAFEGSRADIRLATNEYKGANEDGSRKEEVNWFTLVGWGKLAEVLQKRGVEKGDVITIEGSLKWNAYEDKNGNKRESHNIVISAFDIVSRKADREKLKAA